MLQRIIAVALVAIVCVSLTLAGEAYAEAPDFQRTGYVDDVQLEEGRITIDDMPFRLSESLVVHSTQASNVSKRRVRAGIKVGYKYVNGDVITDLWLLPETYDLRRRR